MKPKNYLTKDSYPEILGIALATMQQALSILANWAEAQLPEALKIPENDVLILRSRNLMPGWQKSNQIDVLHGTFSKIKLAKGATQKYYWPTQAIANCSPCIPYPVLPSEPTDVDLLKNQVKAEIKQLSIDDWANFSLLLLLLEKYGSYLGLGESDISFFDRVRMTAAIATSLAPNPDAENLCLVGADLSGIQSFIYTIASEGALKSLRARSFYLELVAEEVTQQLLDRLQLPRTNIIYTGGGKSFILAPATDQTHATVVELKATFNAWLREEFQNKICLNLAAHDFPTEHVGTADFGNHWEQLNKTLSQQKSRKFDLQIGELLIQKDAHDPCRICNRDDLKPGKLKPLGGDGVEACPTCNQMWHIGQQLYRVKAIVRTTEAKLEQAVPLKAAIQFNLDNQPIYYHLFDNQKPVLTKNPDSLRMIYLVNNWDISAYRFNSSETQFPSLLLLGNYGQSVEREDKNGKYQAFMSAAEMCETSKGIKRLGHLRMDVDRLGQIFSRKGLQDFTLPRLAGLSRQMSYFFKVYLNSLAENRRENFLKHKKKQAFKALTDIDTATEAPGDASPKTDGEGKKQKSDRPNLLFIYSGGDDFFVTGAWDELVEFAFDVYQSFRAYTGNHPDITLSGGISLSGPKYPLYQSAADSGEAEEWAKNNGRDSLTLFDQTFKWDVWLGAEQQFVHDIEAIAPKTRRYLGTNLQLGNPKLELFGILPFVTRLNTVLANTYPKSFVQNLLTTAQLQEQFIKDAPKTKPNHQDLEDHTNDIRYFLHLPRVAYTLARLPSQVKNSDGFEAIRTSLKSPYNAPYFRAIATWIDLLNRRSSSSISSTPSSTDYDS